MTPGVKVVMFLMLAVTALLVLFAAPQQPDPTERMPQQPKAEGNAMLMDNQSATDIPMTPPAASPSPAMPQKNSKKREVSIVVALAPSINPDWLYPNHLPCEGVVCNVHYNTTPQEYGITEANRAFLKTADIYAIYINGPMHDEFYDIHANPYHLTLMVSSNECMKGREKVLANMKHWWIHRFALNESYWKLFHITHTLEQGSVVPWSYYNHLLDIPEVPVWLRDNPPISLEKKHLEALALFMSSHPGHTYNRFQIVRDLSRYMKIDYYGKGRFKAYFRNTGGAPNVTRRARPDCPMSTWYEPTVTLCMIRPYFFNLALENSIALDYVTEKLYDPLLAGAIPVYLGAPNVENFVPPHSIIKIDDFEHSSHLAYYLQCVAKDRKLYEYYRKWKERSSPSWERLRAAPHPFCRACQLVAEGHPVLSDVKRRIPKPVQLLPENRGSQRPFEKCLMPGTTLRGYDDPGGGGKS